MDDNFGGWAIWQELSWGSVDDDGIGIHILDYIHQWDLPQLVVRVPPSPEDGVFRDSDDGVVGVVDVDGVLVKHCDVVGICDFPVLSSEC